MIPLRINLLPPQKNHYLERMIHFQFIKNILEIMLFAICLTGIMLLGGQSVLQDYFDDLTIQMASISDQYAQTNQQIIKINKIINNTDKIQNEYYSWTTKLVNFANALPTNITLNSLSFDQKNKSLIFNGTAPTREDLLTLQEQIKKIDWVNSLEVPLSQLTTKQNIPFLLTAILK